MAQQITIIVMIDVEAAINANTLEGNIYLTDNLRTEGSQGEGTGQLTTAIRGGYWIDGSQSSEQLLNWLVGGIGSLPPTLPRGFHAHQSRLTDKISLHGIKSLLNAKGGQNINDLTAKLHDISRAAGATGYLSDGRGNFRDIGIKVMNLLGEPYDKEREPASNISYLPPFISNITGEAVDEGVIYPAQYGTPIHIKDGWYWSASTDTNKPGCYAYTMHITLLKLSHVGDKAVWEPVCMTYDSYLHVATGPMTNGFTGGAMGMLPVL